MSLVVVAHAALNVVSGASITGPKK